MDEQNEIVSLFWTGGLDSTYRLIDLLLCGFIVDPIYVTSKIDYRNSRDVERVALDRIYEIILAKFPKFKDRLLPINIIKEATIPEELMGHFKDIGAGSYITAIEKTVKNDFANHVGQHTQMGRQYPFLAVIALNYIRPVEFGIIFGGRSGGFFLGKTIGEGNQTRINPRLLESKEGKSLVVFDKCRFPILHKSKLEMLISAKARGFLDIMMETWTCRVPIKGSNAACGECPACLYRKSVMEKFEALESE